MKLAVVQMDVAYGDLAKNLDKILAHLESESAAGTDLVVFPECAATGYVANSLEEAQVVAIPPAGLEPIEDACKRLGIHALVGYAEQQPEAVYNTADLFSPDGRIFSYRKSHLPFIGIDRFTAPGNELDIVETKFGNIGILICYDQRAPENARTLALKGADLILLPTNWPEGAEMSANHISRARAAENHVFYACCNRVGTEKGTRFIGQSKILNPSGKTLAEAAEDETTLHAEFDLAEARNKRVVIDAGLYEYDVFADRRPELYEPITKKEPSNK